MTTQAQSQVVFQEAAVHNLDQHAKKGRGRRLRPAGSRTSFTLFLCILPFLVLAFLFSYLPLYGWIYSLYDYKPALGLEGSEFVGLQWFQMLVSSPTQMAQIGQVLLNTLAISFLGIAT